MFYAHFIDSYLHSTAKVEKYEPIMAQNYKFLAAENICLKRVILYKLSWHKKSATFYKVIWIFESIKAYIYKKKFLLP